MAKKKIELVKETLNKVIASILSRPDYSDIVDGDEGAIDARTTMYLNTTCGYENIVIKGHKTGNKHIDTNFPSPRGTGRGYGSPDIMLYNLYGRNEVSLIIEDKAKKASDTKEDTINQAELYTKIINKNFLHMFQWNIV